MLNTHNGVYKSPLNRDEKILRYHDGYPYLIIFSSLFNEFLYDDLAINAMLNTHNAVYKTTINWVSLLENSQTSLYYRIMGIPTT